MFGVQTKVTRSEDADYLFRAVVSRADLEEAMDREIGDIDYSNFKDSVKNRPLHNAYLRVWTAMAALQNPQPYSQPWKGAKK